MVKKKQPANTQLKQKSTRKTMDTHKKSHAKKINQTNDSEGSGIEVRGLSPEEVKVTDVDAE